MLCKSQLLVSVAILSLLGSRMVYAEGTVTGLNDIPGTLPPGNLGAAYTDISGDGTTLAGFVRTGVTSYRPYTFTLNGKTELSMPAGDDVGYAYGISADGRVVAGYSAVDPYSHNKALVWRDGVRTQLADLETRPDALLTPRSSIAYTVSGDGHVVAGTSILSAVPGAGVYHAVRWVDDGAPQDLQGNGFASSFARATSTDGSVVVGYGSTVVSNNSGVQTGGHSEEVFRWTSETGMVGLGVLSAHEALTARSRAFGVSSDGSVIAGVSVSATSVQEAFRWTSGTGMVGLGYFSGGTYSAASGINGDGSVIVGTADRPALGTVGFRWTESGGLQSVGDWLTANGVSVGSNTFSSADGVDDSGNVVFGNGQINGSTQRYIARVTTTTPPTPTPPTPTPPTPTPPTPTPPTPTPPTPTPPTPTPPGSGVIGLDDYMQSLAGLPASLSMPVSMATLSMWGAHHRILADNGIAASHCFWVTGDLARQNEEDRNQYLGEVGACTDIGDFRVGGSFGLTQVNQDLAFGGSSRMSGYYFLGEADYIVPGTGLVASLTGYAGNWNADISRNYLNGADTDTGRGSPDANTWAVRARVDWLNAVTYGAVSLSPYAAYTQTRGTVDAYTEQGGGFPVAVDGYKQTTKEGRLGTAVKVALGARTDLRVSGEWVHRFDGDGPAVTGAILGDLGTFSTPGQSVSRNWARFGADLDQRIASNAVLSMSVHAAAGQSEDTSVSGSVSLKLGF